MYGINMNTKIIFLCIFIIFLLFIILNCRQSKADERIQNYSLVCLNLKAGQRAEQSRAFGPFIAGNEVWCRPQDWQSLPTPPLCLSTDLKSNRARSLSLSPPGHIVFRVAHTEHICPELSFSAGSCLYFSAFSVFLFFPSSAMSLWYLLWSSWPI